MCQYSFILVNTTFKQTPQLHASWSLLDNSFSSGVSLSGLEVTLIEYSPSMCCVNTPSNLLKQIQKINQPLFNNVAKVLQIISKDGVVHIIKFFYIRSIIFLKSINWIWLNSQSIKHVIIRI